MGDPILQGRDEAGIGDVRLLPAQQLERGSRLEMRDRHIGPALVQNHHHREDSGDVEDGKRGPYLVRARHLVADAKRSEEHTSELQSLMRSSYAVFCLKKKSSDLRTHT